MSKPVRAGAPDEIQKGLDIFYAWYAESGLSRDGGLTDPNIIQVEDLLKSLLSEWRGLLPLA